MWYFYNSGGWNPQLKVLDFHLTAPCALWCLFFPSPGRRNILCQKFNEVLKTRASKILANVLFFNLHGGYKDVPCIIIFKLHYLNVFDTDAIFHHLKKNWGKNQLWNWTRQVYNSTYHFTVITQLLYPSYIRYAIYYKHRPNIPKWNVFLLMW